MAYATPEMRKLADDWENAIQSAVCSGIVGDSRHNYGYHRAANEVPSSDYSRQLPGDRNNIDWDAADALDMSHSPGDMKLITGRFYQSWKSQTDLRLNYVREVIGTLDGRNVIYMDTQSGEQGTADSSHLWHIHVGGLRCNAHNKHAMDAVLSIVVGESWSDYCAKHSDDPITHGAQPSPAPAPAPAPSGHPAPGPAVAFPLPSGYYFGPRSGPRESISCELGERFNGRYAREWLQMWANQLSRRGWSVGKGKQYLHYYGNDGYYGNEYEELARAFQQDQHIEVDGLIGAQTWWAAYHNPVS